MSDPPSGWRRCSACKRPIDFGAPYYVCSVSTCNRPRTALQFCSVGCWEVHLPIARHRDAWAEDRIAPSAAGARDASPTPAARSARGATARSGTAPREPRRILARGPEPASRRPAPPREVLIIASRLKDYIRAVSEMNTSDRVLDPLSEILREVADRAIENARAEGRKTVLDRDVPKR